jgi:excisionase family DNA binding protein
MTVQTFSLSEVAAMVLPPEWSDSERWLARRLNRGEIPGYRVGRKWRMTETQVDEFIERFTKGADNIAPRAVAPEPMSVVDGLSPRSRRRLRRSA